MQPTDFNLTHAAYGVAELLEILPIGRTSLYAAIKNGKLKAVKNGKTTLFLANDVADFLSALPSVKSGGSDAS